MAATDRDGGDINTLINNYVNNDTGYTGMEWGGGQKDRRGEGHWGGGHEENRKMRRGFEKARRKTDREGKGTGQDWRMGRGKEVRREWK